MATKYKTLKEFIALEQQTPISYHALSFLEPLEDIQFTIHNVVDDYIEEINRYAYKVTFTEKEFLRYKYRPKLLANDIYGNGEYYFIIMAMNNIANVKDFDKKSVLLLKKETLTDIISKIINAERNHLASYNNKNS